MATCPDCGGRGGSYDDQGNWYQCYKCQGRGQIDIRPAVTGTTLDRAVFTEHRPIR